MKPVFDPVAAEGAAATQVPSPLILCVFGTVLPSPLLLCVFEPTGSNLSVKLPCALPRLALQ
jgi:hypothetical protein